MSRATFIAKLWLLLCCVVASRQGSFSITGFEVPQSVPAGEDVELKCRYELGEGDKGTEQFYVKWWLKKGRDEITTTQLYQRLGVLSGVAVPEDVVVKPNELDTIVMKDVTPVDSGTYECEVSIELKEDRKHQDMIVFTQGSGPLLNVTTVADGPDEDEEEDVFIQCEAFGVAPEPDFIFTVNGEEVDVIPYVSNPYNEGVYNIFGNVTVSKNEAKGKEVRCELIYVNPNVTHQPFIASEVYSTRSQESSITSFEVPQYVPAGEDVELKFHYQLGEGDSEKKKFYVKWWLKQMSDDFTPVLLYKRSNGEPGAAEPEDVASSQESSITRFEMPQYVPAGEDVELKCHYQLGEGDSEKNFFYVKWYLKRMSNNCTPELLYKRLNGEPGAAVPEDVEVKLNELDTIMLKNVPTDESGTYECEVSINLKKVRKHQDMIIFTQGSGPLLNVTMVADGPDEDEEEDVFIQCEAFGVAPEPDFIFTVNGEEVHVIPYVSNLYNEGVYNISGNVTVSKDEAKGKEVRCELIYVNPNITHQPFIASEVYPTQGSGPLLNVTTVADGPDEDEEEDVFIQCEAIGVAPEPDFIFTVNGKEVNMIPYVSNPYNEGLYNISGNVTVSKDEAKGKEVRCELIYVNPNITHQPFIASEVYSKGHSSQQRALWMLLAVPLIAIIIIIIIIIRRRRTSRTSHSILHFELFNFIRCR